MKLRLNPLGGFTVIPRNSLIVSQDITGSVTDKAPSEKAVFDELSLKADVMDLVDTYGKTDDLVTLSGVAANQTNLGTFDGTTIPNSSTIKVALQSLETLIEAIKTVHETATLTSAAAATPVELINNTAVGTGKKFYLQGFILKINGATPWSVVSEVRIQDNDGNNLIVIPVAILTANALLGIQTATITVSDAISLGTGATTARGVRIVADSNGLGSDLVCTVFGIIK